MESFPNHNVGSKFYVSSSNGAMQTTSQSDTAEANVSHIDQHRCLTAELDKLCGPPFICNVESSTGEAAVVYTNFGNTEAGAAEGQGAAQTSVAMTQEFHSLSLLASMPTSDGLGVKLTFKRSVDRGGFPTGPEENYITNSPAVAVTRTRRSKLGRKRKALRAKKPDSELLAERLRFHQARFYNMCDQDSENEFIRCVHWYNDGRTFAFGSVFVETGGCRKAIVAVLWHTTIRPHRAVCVSLSLKGASIVQNLNTRQDQGSLVANCSCSPLLSQTKGDNGGCYHAQVCLADEAFNRMVSSEIRRREHIQSLQDRGDTVFGQCISFDNGSPSSINLSVLLDRNASKNSTLASPWLFFMMFDVQSLLFVPVSKVKGKPFRCFLCRIPLSRRGVCGHEETAKKVSQYFRKRRSGRTGVLLELALPNEKGDDTSAETESAIPPLDEQADEDNEHEGAGNQSVSVTQIYTPIDVRRPILPCRGEWDNMVSVAKALDKVRSDEVLVFDDRVQGNCHKCGNPNNGENHDGYSRNVSLFTLNHGTHRVKVYDWWCPVCEETRRFSGRGTGLFPVTHNSAFTTELMYIWLEMTCFQGYSFRNAYRTTRAFQRTASKILMLKRQRHDFDEESNKTREANRRRANDALREFMKLLDTNSPLTTENLFSCSTCEIPLTDTDCADLGITKENGSKLKRFKALVIDGTASGILTELPPMEREHFKVSEPTRLTQKLNEAKKILKSKAHRLALEQIMNLARECFRSRKQQSSDSFENTVSGSGKGRLRFWVNKTGTNSCHRILEPQKYLTEVEQKIAKLFLQETPCFCSHNRIIDSRGTERSNDRHERECFEVRKVMQKRKEDKSVFQLLRSLFSIDEGNPELVLGNEIETVEHLEEPQSNAPVSTNRGESNIEEESQEDAEDNNEEEAEGRTGETSDAVNGSSSENREDDETSPEDEEADDGRESDSEIRELFNEIHRCRRVSGIWLTIVPPFQRSNSQMFECTLLLVEFILFEHVAMPYVGRFDSKATADIEEEQSMTSFSEKSMKVHGEVLCALEMFSNTCTNVCNRTSSSTSIRTDCLCFLRLKHAALSITVANPILSTFCQELLKLRKPLDNAFQSLIKSLVAVLHVHLKTSKTYFTIFEKGCSKQCKEYWSTWGRPVINNAEEHEQEPSQNESESSERGSKRAKAKSRSEVIAKEELENSLVSGICFPGRTRCRPSIIFKSKNEKACNKKYTKPRSHTPGLMTVQCACDAPKLIGFIVMTQAESTALALSSFLSHFPVPPKTVYYDNACNLFLSVMLRVPWVLKDTRLEVDRFHYKSHKCCSYFDPDVYPEFDTHYTETAESINARIKKTLQQLRYLKGNHLVPFLRTRFSFINLAATFKARYESDDIEEEDMTLFFQQIFKCSCSSCKVLENSSSKESE